MGLPVWGGPGDEEEVLAAVEAWLAGSGPGPDTAPAEGEYDAVLVPGAGARLNHVEGLIQDGLLTEEVVALVGQQATEQGAVALESTFGPLEQPLSWSHEEEESNAGWLVRSWDRGAEVRLGLVTAPSGDVHRPADAADVFRFWGARVADDLAGRSVLVVTDPAAAVRHWAAAVRMLGLMLKARVEVIGVPGEPLPDGDTRLALDQLRSALL